MLQNRFHTTCLPLLIVGGLLMLSVTLHAQTPAAGKYPAYAQAMSDLRDARATLGVKGTKLDVRQEDEKAIRQIDLAITDLKHASIDDGKGMGNSVPVDANLDRAGRYAKTNELLDRARQDLAGAPEVAESPGARDRLLHDIDAARTTVHQSIVLTKTGR